MIQNQFINKAIDYILSNLNSSINIDDVATYCGFSKFYLERLFKAETGESIYAFIKRAKVEQSAFRLKIERERSITEIGNDYGYSSANYATLFKKHFEETPANFRKNIFKETKEHQFYTGIENKIETYEECCKKITIETLPDYFVLYQRRKGNYSNLVNDWCSFRETFKDFVTEETLFIERTMDDPSITDSDACIYEVCMTVKKNDPRLTVQNTASAKEEIPNTMILKGGKFAIYHYKGYPQMIYSAYQSFFCSWLSKTGNRIDNRSGFDIYRMIDPETIYMEMDICIPIK